MAVSVASINDDLLVRNSRKQGILRQKIGIPDESRVRSGLKSRIKALVGVWGELRDGNAPRCQSTGIRQFSELSTTFDPRDDVVREIFKPYGSAQPIAVPPPTYDESLQDLPPDYTTTDAFAAVQFAKNVSLAGKDDIFNAHKPRSGNADFPEFYAAVDLSKIEGIRSYAGKKAKQAAKKAQQAKWADSDNEDMQSGGADGGDDGENNGGGTGGSGTGGDGGEPPDGNGGDDGDDWFTNWGGSKKDKVSFATHTSEQSWPLWPHS